MGKKTKYDKMDAEVVKEAVNKHNMQIEVPEEMASPDEKKLLHGLLVHHIELEMQNDELMATQQNLNEVRDKYFGLYNLSPLGILMVSSKGVIEESNLTAMKILGLEKSKLLSRSIRSFILDEDLQIFNFHQKKLLESNEKQQFELQLKIGEEKVLWVHFTSALLKDKKGNLYNSMTIADITEHKQALARMNLQEQILGAIEEAVLVTDIKGIITYYNKAAAMFYGWGDVEITGRNFLDFISTKDSGNEVAGIYKNSATGLFWKGKLTLQKKGGVKFPAMVNITAALNTEGIPIGTIVVSEELKENIQAK